MYALFHAKISTVGVSVITFILAAIAFSSSASAYKVFSNLFGIFELPRMWIMPDKL